MMIPIQRFIFSRGNKVYLHLKDLVAQMIVNHYSAEPRPSLLDLPLFVCLFSVFVFAWCVDPITLFEKSAGIVQLVIPLAFDQFFFADQVWSCVEITTVKPRQQPERSSEM